MHPISALFFMLLLFALGACEKKTDHNDTIPVENTTEVLDKTPASHHLDNDRFKVSKPTDYTSISKKPVVFSDTFTLSNPKHIHYTITVSNRKVTFKEHTNPIVLISFFASWCPPCLYEIPYLNDLQKKYKKHLLLIGVLTHDNMDTSMFNSFLAKHTIRYYVSNGTQNNDYASLTAKTLHLPHNFPIPLTVMYVEGKYFTHYEGIVPVEMIEYDIAEAMKTLK